MWGIDISKFDEERRGDLSQRLHELQETCSAPIQVGDKTYGIVLGMDTPALTCEILQAKGYNVNPYYGCGHCFQGMPNTGGRCDCECHGSAS